MAVYTIEIYKLNVDTADFTRLAEIITFRDLEFFEGNNIIGGASFNMNIMDEATDPDIIGLEKVVLIKRDGTPVWVGRIDGLDGGFEDVDGILTVKCLDWLSHLSTRFTDQNTKYTATDAGAIATSLINLTQTRPNGTLNIATGTIETIGNTSNTFEYSVIADALINSADNIASYSFYFRPTVDSNGLLTDVGFNVVQSRGTYRTDLPALSLGTNVQRLTFASQSTIVNTTTALGNGTGEDVILSFEEDTYSQVAYTRKEDVVKLSDYTIQNNLDRAVVALNNDRKVARYSLNIELNPGGDIGYNDINIGDVLNVNLVIPNTFINFVGTARVIELNVSVDENGVEFITPKIDFIK